MQPQQANVNVTQEDIIICQHCQSDAIIPVSKAVKVANPLLGQPPLISMLGVVRFRCADCRKEWPVEDSLTIRDSKSKLIGV